MRFIDCHCHMGTKMVKPEEFLKRLDAAKADACAVFSFAPEPQAGEITPDCPTTWQDKLKLLADFAKADSDRIYTMFWIDPLDDDALEQVDAAVKAGITGFKVICDRFYPYDEKPMKVFTHIAEVGKPLHFHSGILYSPHASSKYNRPVWFEDLLQIPNLRMALAHVSWPWLDECIAVYGHWNSLKYHGMTSSEMFIDTTPGTPALYREEMLTKLYTVGIDVEDNIMLGIDCEWDYSAQYSEWVRNGDEFIFDKLRLSDEVRQKYYWKNYLRFIGK